MRIQWFGDSVWHIAVLIYTHPTLFDIFSGISAICLGAVMCLLQYERA